MATKNIENKPVCQHDFCDYSSLPSSSYCILHSPKQTFSEQEWIKAYKKHIAKFGPFFKECIFHFPFKIDLGGEDFVGQFTFWYCTFHGPVQIFKMTLYGYLNFEGSEFHNFLNIGQVNFEHNKEGTYPKNMPPPGTGLNLNKIVAHGNVSVAVGQLFSGAILLHESQINGILEISRIEFSEYRSVLITNAKLNGQVRIYDLMKAININIYNCNINGPLEIKNISLAGSVTFVSNTMTENASL